MQTDIVPVQVFPATATRFFLRAGNLGPPPGYYYQLQSVTIIPEVPEVKDADGNVVQPAVPASEQITVLKDGNASMTDAQWQSWPADLGTEGDDDYQLNCITENLGLTRA